MPVCAACQAELEAEDRYCQSCGRPVTQPGRQSSVAGPAQSASPPTATAPVEAHAPSRWSLKRTAAVVAIVAGITVAAAVALILVGAHRDSGAAAGPSPAAAFTDGSSPSAGPSATTPTPTAEDQKRALIKQMERWLRASATGRRGIVSAVNGTYTFSLQPSVALARAEKAVANRRHLLAQIKATPMPVDARQRRLVSLLRKSVKWSLAGDLSFEKWIRAAGRAQSAGASRAPLNADYQRGAAYSRRADPAKQALARLVNRMAAPFGLRSNWSASDF